MHMALVNGEISDRLDIGTYVLEEVGPILVFFMRKKMGMSPT